jgi:antitoxin (DNA-binding transcriptional repressor) of toxin-antitoxin stability system
LPQRTLRNEISRVLRDVEGGARFEITVNGRVVAELGPPGERRSGTDAATAHAFIKRTRERHKDDPEFGRIIAAGRIAELREDPWERAARRAT